MQKDWGIKNSGAYITYNTYKYGTSKALGLNILQC